MRLVSILLLLKVLFACAYTDCTVVEAVAAALLLRVKKRELAARTGGHKA